ncbi:MAG: MerR family transcriptional regulator [Streptococcaceae bacterium]|jgi:MerR family glutamine synthetase transcriptional repressor|nr:MerR family transcriptional regulator [Streptococcaceae bacterium]
MSERELSRQKAILAMGAVMELTGLSARQIRYYEEQQLVVPTRNGGNRRLYSLADIDKLFDVKELLGESHSITEVKRVLSAEKKQRVSADTKYDHQLEEELQVQSRFYHPSSTNIFNNPRY